MLMLGLVLSQPLTFFLPVWPSGTVLTHGCLHAPAHTLHLPCAGGCLGQLLRVQHAVCPGPSPAGLPLPAVASLLPAPASRLPRPPREAALRGPVGLPRTPVTHPAGPAPRRMGWVFRGRRYTHGVFVSGCDGFKASWWDGEPKGQVFRQRGPQPHSAVTAPQPLWILLLPCQMYPLPPGILLLKALLLPKRLLPECFRAQG